MTPPEARDVDRAGAARDVDRAGAARSTVWSAVENGGLALVSFASLVVYAQFLGPAEFGLFSIVLALIELLDVLVSMLFHDALVQRPAVTERHFDTAFTASMLLALALRSSAACRCSRKPGPHCRGPSTSRAPSSVRCRACV
jgi:hypothetical protein